MDFRGAAIRIITFVSLCILLTLNVSADTPADSVTITFRAYKPSSLTVFVPGQFNGWGPNSSGVISPGAVSQMTYSAGNIGWIKTYVFKIHDATDSRRTMGDSIFEYKFNQGGAVAGWGSDSLNPEKNVSDNNNSVLRLTKVFWFEQNLVKSGSQYTYLAAGLIHDNGATITSIQLTAGITTSGATTTDITSSYNASTMLLDYTFPSPIPTAYFVRLVAYTSRGDSAVYYAPGLNIITIAVPSYAKQGVTLPSVASNDSTTFVVRAPGRDYVRILINPIGQSPQTATPVLLRKGTDAYTWWINLKLSPATYEYLYLMPDGTTLYDPWGRYNGTNGSRFTVGAEGLTADDYVWHDGSWQRPPLNKVVIYELNLAEAIGGYKGYGSFQQVNFKDLIPLLPYYDSLGVNTIELMPINDYGLVGAAGFSWGYDLNTDLALEPEYGTPRDFKTLVDSAHARGIAIVVDVVFNHLNDTGPLWQISPSLSTNPYFHTPGTNYNEVGSSLFKDLNHWATETQEYCYAALKQWVDVYHVDGFRYDFTHGIGWLASNPNVGILGWANKIDQDYNGKIYQMAEHLPDSPTLIHISGLTSGWHDAFHDNLYNEAVNHTTSLDDFETYILDLNTYAASDVPDNQHYYDDRTGPVQIGIDHDEWSWIYGMIHQAGVASDEAVRRDKAYATFVFASLGVPLMWEGQEHGEGRGWVDDNAKLSYRPVQWTLGSTTAGQDHFKWYRALINQRVTNPALYQGNLRKLYKYYTERCIVWGFEDPSTGSKVMALVNLNSSQQTLSNVPWLAAGTWYDISDSSQFIASGTTIGSFTLPSYTARVFTNIPPGSPANLVASSSNIDFGAVTLGSSKPLALTLQNNGGDSLIVSAITSSNTDFVVKTTSTRMGPSRSFIDSVRFIPSHTGQDTSKLVIFSNSAGGNDTVMVTGTGQPLLAPVLVLPADQAADQPLILAFRWRPAAAAQKYELQIAIDSAFTALVTDDSTLTDTAYAASLSSGTQYMWRVRSLSGAYKSDWTALRSLTVTVQQFSVTSPLGPRWNLVSLPILAGDSRVSVLYPHAQTQAFAYEGGYVGYDELQNGKGYWLKSDIARVITFTGPPVAADTVAVTAGWNMIGSIASPVPVTTIGSSVPGMIAGNFFGYSTAYEPKDTLKPGFGYWVKVNEDGSLYISSAGLAAKAHRIAFVSAGEAPPAPPSNDDMARNAVPTEFSLGQNYPNPFNPATTIQFSLPEPSLVTLTVFDMLGQEAAALVKGESMAAGRHQVTFDAGSAAGGLSSGVYYYRISAGQYSATRKLVLVR